jgi:hypothetical protein
VRRSYLAILVVAVVLCAALWSGRAGFARDATTSPGQRVDSLVLLENQGISMSENAHLPRGVIVVFYVRNLTKTPKNFRFLGKQTKIIEPGKQAVLKVTLLKRGVFPYLSTVNPSRKMRGLFFVY